MLDPSARCTRIPTFCSRVPMQIMHDVTHYFSLQRKHVEAAIVIGLSLFPRG